MSAPRAPEKALVIDEMLPRVDVVDKEVPREEVRVLYSVVPEAS